MGERWQMSGPNDVDWTWLSHDAIEEFKRQRIEAGGSAASASSYASGARAYVRYCQTRGLDPVASSDSFHAYLNRSGDLSAKVRSDYRSHARAFARFLRSMDESGPPGLRAANASTSPGATQPASRAATSSGDSGGLAHAVGSGHIGDDSADLWLDSFAERSTAQLLAGYARTLEALRSRGVLRTANAPAGDYAEWLVWRAFGGRIDPNSTKSHDVTDADGRRLQVKARLVSAKPTPGQLQTSVFRSWNFDLAVLVQLHERDYTVVRASMVPADVFEEGRSHARWSEHVKGWAVHMTPALMEHVDSVDATTQLRQAADQS